MKSKAIRFICTAVSVIFISGCVVGPKPSQDPTMARIETGTSLARLSIRFVDGKYVGSEFLYDGDDGTSGVQVWNLTPGRHKIDFAMGGSVVMKFEPGLVYEIKYLNLVEEPYDARRESLRRAGVRTYSAAPTKFDTCQSMNDGFTNWIILPNCKLSENTLKVAARGRNDKESQKPVKIIRLTQKDKRVWSD